MVFTKAMPTGKNNNTTTDGGGGTTGGTIQRTTFRPPWVKDGPNPLPVPTTPWQLKNTRRDSNTKEPSTTTTNEMNPLAGVQLRKTTTKEPQEINGSQTIKDTTFKRPQLKPVPPKDEQNKTTNLDKQQQNKLPPIKLKKIQMTRDEEIDREIPATRNRLVREESMRRISQTPQPPPPPPLLNNTGQMPPPPPPPPQDFQRKPLSDEQLDKLEQLKSRPKIRPDWTAMLKEIESNKCLKHVECNDRSQPLLPDVKTPEHYLYESEKPNVHNELLKQIQGGIQLKKVKTNDRSRPILEGLRKFRRQMTIEEQIQKSQSMASIPPEEIPTEEVDEMDDIDKVRDDLQSTKQMLAIELRNKELKERENKKLLERIKQLEQELDKWMTSSNTTTSTTVMPTDKMSDSMDSGIKTLKYENEQLKRQIVDNDKNMNVMLMKFDAAKLEIDDLKRRNQQLDKRLHENLQQNNKKLLNGTVGNNNNNNNNNKTMMMNNGDDDEDEDLDEDEDEDEDDVDGEMDENKRVERELKQLRVKLKNFKNKQDHAKKERLALKEIMKKHQDAIKDEKKKYKALQKEVDKMVALMKDSSDEEDEESDEEEDEDEEESDDDDDDESSDSSDDESDDSDDDDSSDTDTETTKTNEQIKSKLLERIKRHEKILDAMKKGNFLLKTNAERLQDDLNKQKELTANLQQELDSVLAELG